MDTWLFCFLTGYLRGSSPSAVITCIAEKLSQGSQILHGTKLAAHLP